MQGPLFSCTDATAGGRSRSHSAIRGGPAIAGKPKDYWLGEYGSAASHEMNHRVLTEWESNGRRLPKGIGKPTTAAEDVGRVECAKGFQPAAPFHAIARCTPRESPIWADPDHQFLACMEE
jgi:hypothetical protein